MRDRQIVFSGTISLWLASPLVKILESFAEHLVKKEKVKLGNSYLRPTGVEVSFAEEPETSFMVRTLSPITVYSTLQSSDSKKKTYYYSPFEAEFGELIRENLLKKWILLNDRPHPNNGHAFTISPEKVSNRNEHIIVFKGTVIKAWSGMYRLEGSSDLIGVAFDTGLGSKNSQGFGMVERYVPNHTRRSRPSRIADRDRGWREGRRGC